MSEYERYKYVNPGKNKIEVFVCTHNSNTPCLSKAERDNKHQYIKQQRMHKTIVV
jgi:hypothetical protein